MSQGLDEMSSSDWSLRLATDDAPVDRHRMVRRMTLPALEDGAGPDEQREYELDFPWTPILVAGATKLAEAFGTKIGEALGDAFIDALTGDDADEKWKAEILATLSRIEGKVDQILMELHRFPDLIRAIVREEYLAAHVYAESQDILSRTGQVGTYSRIGWRRKRVSMNIRI